MKTSRSALVLFGAALVSQACSKSENSPAELNGSGGGVGDNTGGGRAKPFYATCEEDPACDPPFGNDVECDVHVSGIPLMGGYGGLLNDLGGAGGYIVCLDPVF